MEDEFCGRVFRKKNSKVEYDEVLIPFLKSEEELPGEHD